MSVKIFKGNFDEVAAAFTVLKDYEVRTYLLAQTIRAEQMNLRAGNAHTKTRGEVRGGGKKPWKQKGTGRARHGSTRSPIWVGGGVTFGPRNTTNWHCKINKTARVSALKSIFADRLQENTVYQMEDGFDFAKTKSAVEILDTFNAKNSKKNSKTSMLLYTSEDKANLAGFVNTEIKMMNAGNLKIYLLASCENYILTPKALQMLETKLN